MGRATSADPHEGLRPWRTSFFFENLNCRLVHLDDVVTDLRRLPFSIRQPMPLWMVMVLVPPELK